MREIFDNSGQVAVALDQQDIARPQQAPQDSQVARKKRLVTSRGLLKVPGNGATNSL
jgi:hemin uptake protein HemP